MSGHFKDKNESMISIMYVIIQGAKLLQKMENNKIFQVLKLCKEATLDSRKI